MAKNYVQIYEGGNLAIALEQKIFIKQEVTGQRGEMVLPDGTDFIYHLAGGSINFSQPTESSPHKSGRHHTSVIKQKTQTSWTLPTFFNIDTAQGAATTDSIDKGVRVLHKSMFGNEDVLSGYCKYDSSVDPNITFTIMEIGDLWAKQAPGSFVESANIQLPGDGTSQVEWAGSSKTVITVGIGKSLADNNSGNSVTLEAGEGLRFPVGARVMLVKGDNTKSADTVADSARIVTSVVGDVVTLDGAVLADADGSVEPVYLVYYEPENAGAINDPQTGLEGSVSIAGFGNIAKCIRNLTLNCTNNHELQDFCFGEEGLGGAMFVPGGRLTVEVSMEMNLSQQLVAFINNLKDFDGDDITVKLGDVTGRHMEVLLPKVIFQVPEISVPETGTIPVSFTGQANQTALDAADEITISYP